jgi:hypothetical protein
MKKNISGTLQTLNSTFASSYQDDSRQLAELDKSIIEDEFKEFHQTSQLMDDSMLISQTEFIDYKMNPDFILSEQLEMNPVLEVKT